jgi:hypothetical protein
LRDKNIQVNLSTKETDETHMLVKKPEKTKNLCAKIRFQSARKHHAK